MASYVPRVLICGSVEKFKKKIGDKPAEIVGKVIFEDTGDDVKLFFGEHALTSEELCQILNDVAEYLIFTDDMEFDVYNIKFPLNWQVMSADSFAKISHNGFFSYSIVRIIAALLTNKYDFNRVLDFDCFFAKSCIRILDNWKTKLDCVAENFHRDFYPIHENVYGKIYRTKDEYKFRRFDAIILTSERTPEEFVDVLIETNNLSDTILAFVRKNSVLESWLDEAEKIFFLIEVYRTENGAWWLIKKITPPVDVGVYVVTHKDAKLDALPEGYKIIHAGHALAKKDFGYMGDDTGDNISYLNPFLDETTVLYWIWKNTTHTHTGFVHYRRFFMLDKEENFDVNKILSTTEILNILDEYDIIVCTEGICHYNQREMMILSTGQPDFIRVAELIVRRNLARTHPDYLDAFDEMMNNSVFFPCGMHVTRRNIFNAYCEWLFSFILDALQEVRDKVIIKGKSIDELSHDYSRVIGFFVERMLTVWLMKNHLRIKTLAVKLRENI